MDRDRGLADRSVCERARAGDRSAGARCGTGPLEPWWAGSHAAPACRICLIRVRPARGVDVLVTVPGEPAWLAVRVGGYCVGHAVIVGIDAQARHERDSGTRHPGCGALRSCQVELPWPVCRVRRSRSGRRSAGRHRVVGESARRFQGRSRHGRAHCGAEKIRPAQALAVLKPLCFESLCVRWLNTSP